MNLPIVNQVGGPSYFTNLIGLRRRIKKEINIDCIRECFLELPFHYDIIILEVSPIVGVLTIKTPREQRTMMGQLKKHAPMQLVLGSLYS